MNMPDSFEEQYARNRLRFPLFTVEARFDMAHVSTAMKKSDLIGYFLKITV